MKNVSVVLWVLIILSTCRIDQNIKLVLGFGNMTSDEAFRNALYMIDIGQNDLANSFSKNLSYVQVIKRIPSVTIEIKNAVKVSLQILFSSKRS